MSRQDDYLVLAPVADSTAAKADVHKYLHDGFFSTDSVAARHVAIGSAVEAGDPVPYSLRTDNVMSIVLIACFVLFAVAMSHSRRFIGRQLKSLAFPSHADDSLSETAGELRFQLSLVLAGCIELAIITYIYATENISQTFALPDDFTLVAILTGCFVAYYVFKAGLYSVVDTVFFGGKGSLQMLKSLLFLTALQGELVYPAILLLVYFDISLQNTLYYLAFVLFLNKILAFYKGWLIFFKRNGGLLQNFLYFCALEVTPLLMLGGALTAMLSELRVNY